MQNSVYAKHVYYLHRDGLAPYVLKYLAWPQYDGQLFKAHIPDTIVFQARRLEAWYYTCDEEGPEFGCIKRHPKYWITWEQVERVFSRGKSAVTDIVAAYYTAPEGRSGKVLAGYHPPQVQYFTMPQLKEFWENGKKGQIGMLQRFLLPKGGFNTVIRADWTPNSFACQQRKPFVSLLEGRDESDVSALGTWEADEGNSLLTDLSGSSIAEQLHSFHERIADHVAEASEYQGRVIRLQAQYKFDQHGTLYLLCVSLMHLEEINKEQRAAALRTRAETAHFVSGVLRDEWNEALSEMQENLGTLTEVQGGQLRRTQPGFKENEWDLKTLKDEKRIDTGVRGEGFSSAFAHVPTEHDRQREALEERRKKGDAAREKAKDVLRDLATRRKALREERARRLAENRDKDRPTTAPAASQPRFGRHASVHAMNARTALIPVDEIREKAGGQEARKALQELLAKAGKKPGRGRSGAGVSFAVSGEKDTAANDQAEHKGDTEGSDKDGSSAPDGMDPSLAETRSTADIVRAEMQAEALEQLRLSSRSFLGPLRPSTVDPSFASSRHRSVRTLNDDLLAPIPISSNHGGSSATSSKGTGTSTGRSFRANDRNLQQSTATPTRSRSPNATGQSLTQSLIEAFTEASILLETDAAAGSKPAAAGAFSFSAQPQDYTDRKQLQPPDHVLGAADDKVYQSILAYRARFQAAARTIDEAEDEETSLEALKALKTTAVVEVPTEDPAAGRAVEENAIAKELAKFQTTEDEHLAKPRFSGLGLPPMNDPQDMVALIKNAAKQTTQTFDRTKQCPCCGEEYAVVAASIRSTFIAAHKPKDPKSKDTNSKGVIEDPIELAKLAAQKAAPKAVQFSVVLKYFNRMCEVLSIRPFTPATNSALWDGSAFDSEAAEAMAPKPNNYWPRYDQLFSVTRGIGVHGVYPTDKLNLQQVFDAEEQLAYAVAGDAESARKAQKAKQRALRALSQELASKLRRRARKVLVSEIPPPLALWLPGMSPIEFRSCLGDPLFLSRTLPICPKCYSIIVAVQEALKFQGNTRETFVETVTTLLPKPVDDVDLADNVLQVTRTSGNSTSVFAKKPAPHQLRTLAATNAMLQSVRNTVNLSRVSGSDENETTEGKFDGHGDTHPDGSPFGSPRDTGAPHLDVSHTAKISSAALTTDTLTLGSFDIALAPVEKKPAAPLRYSLKSSDTASSTLEDATSKPEKVKWDELIQEEGAEGVDGDTAAKAPASATSASSAVDLFLDPTALELKRDETFYMTHEERLEKFREAWMEAHGIESEEDNDDDANSPSTQLTGATTPVAQSLQDDAESVDSNASVSTIFLGDFFPYDSRFDDFEEYYEEPPQPLELALGTLEEPYTHHSHKFRQIINSNLQKSAHIREAREIAREAEFAELQRTHGNTYRVNSRGEIGGSVAETFAKRNREVALAAAGPSPLQQMLEKTLKESEIRRSGVAGGIIKDGTKWLSRTLVAVAPPPESDSETEEDKKKKNALQETKRPATTPASTRKRPVLIPAFPDAAPAGAPISPQLFQDSHLATPAFPRDPHHQQQRLMPLNVTRLSTRSATRSAGPSGGSYTEEHAEEHEHGHTYGRTTPTLHIAGTPRSPEPEKYLSYRNAPALSSPSMASPSVTSPPSILSPSSNNGTPRFAQRPSTSYASIGAYPSPLMTPAPTRPFGSPNLGSRHSGSPALSGLHGLAATGAQRRHTEILSPYKFFTDTREHKAIRYREALESVSAGTTAQQQFDRSFRKALGYEVSPSPTPTANALFTSGFPGAAANGQNEPELEPLDITLEANRLGSADATARRLTDAAATMPGARASDGEYLTLRQRIKIKLDAAKKSAMESAEVMATLRNGTVTASDLALGMPLPPYAAFYDDHKGFYALNLVPQPPLTSGLVAVSPIKLNNRYYFGMIRLALREEVRGIHWRSYAHGIESLPLAVTLHSFHSARTITEYVRLHDLRASVNILCKQAQLVLDEFATKHGIPIGWDAYSQAVEEKLQNDEELVFPKPDPGMSSFPVLKKLPRGTLYPLRDRSCEKEHFVWMGLFTMPPSPYSQTPAPKKALRNTPAYTTDTLVRTGLSKSQSNGSYDTLVASCNEPFLVLPPSFNFVVVAIKYPFEIPRKKRRNRNKSKSGADTRRLENKGTTNENVPSGTNDGTKSDKSKHNNNATTTTTTTATTGENTATAPGTQIAVVDRIRPTSATALRPLSIRTDILEDEYDELVKDMQDPGTPLFLDETFPLPEHDAGELLGANGLISHTITVLRNTPQPLFLLNHYDVLTGAQRQHGWRTFSRLLLHAIRYRDLNATVLYAAKCHLAVYAGVYENTRRRNMYSIGDLKAGSRPLPGTLLRLVPGHWLGGRSSLDRHRGFVVDENAFVETTAASRKLEEEVNKYRENMARYIEDRKEMLRRAERLGIHIPWLAKPPSAAGIQPSEKAPTSAEAMLPMDVKNAMEFFDLAKFAGAEIEHNEVGERLQLGVIARRLLMRPNGHVLHCVLSVGFPDEMGKDKAMVIAERKNVLLRIKGIGSTLSTGIEDLYMEAGIRKALEEGNEEAVANWVTGAATHDSVGVNARAMFRIRVYSSETDRVFTRWVHAEELINPLLVPGAFDHRILPEEPVPGNPLIDPAAMVACGDVLTDATERLLCARFVDGEMLQRMIAGKELVSLAEVTKHPLGVHPSVSVGGVYLVSLWTRSKEENEPRADEPLESPGLAAPHTRPEAMVPGSSCTLAVRQANAAAGTQPEVTVPPARRGLPAFRIRVQYLKDRFRPTETVEAHDYRQKYLPKQRKSGRMLVSEMGHFVKTGNFPAQSKLMSLTLPSHVQDSTTSGCKLHTPDSAVEPVYVYDASLSDLCNSSINPFIEQIPKPFSIPTELR